MTAIEAQTAEAQPAAEEEHEGIGELVRDRLRRLRAGEVGSLPVIVGLVAITIFFSLKDNTFHTATNFNNVIVQMAGMTTIAIGVVFVLLLGEIDLSIGYVSGVGGVTVALLQQPDTRYQIAGLLAILVAVAVGALIGAFQGSFVALLGVPSFVVTLAGLLAWQGGILQALGTQGTITIYDNTVKNVSTYSFSDTWGWGLASGVVLIYAAAVVGGAFSRRRAGIRIRHPWLLALRIVLVGGVAFVAVAISNHGSPSGVPFAGVMIAVLLVFWTYVAKRTVFGRHVYAVGGNAEAARRAGINVKRIRILVFMISSAMAALGGVVFAAQITSVDLSAGGGTILLDAISAAVIGGASLFGGRGEVKHALFGAALISTIANGIATVQYSDAIKFIVTGAILLAAVTLDTVLRRRQAAAAR
jgi:D-xylose transport system permease protein